MMEYRYIPITMGVKKDVILDPDSLELIRVILKTVAPFFVSLSEIYTGRCNWTTFTSATVVFEKQ